MTFEFFRQQWGEAFYGFINSEMGRAMLMVLTENNPIKRCVRLPASEQRENSTLFLGQITGWQDVVTAIEKELIVHPEIPHRDVEATYEPEEIEADGGQGSKPAPPPPRPPVARVSPVKKSTRKKK